MLILPDGSKRSAAEITEAIKAYCLADPVVFELYDWPSGGPHDDLLEIDLLSLNAMNAWGGGQPMRWMTEAWLKRQAITEAVKPVSKVALEELDESQAAEEAVKVGKALDYINSIDGYGSTTTAKLFHRLRPNLGPIWDARVCGWYGDEGSWTEWVRAVYRHVREPATLACLMECRRSLNLRLSTLRIWDVVLWQLGTLDRK